MPESRPYTLFARRGPLKGLRVILPLRGRILIGRDMGCHIAVDDRRASRRQCLLSVDEAKERLTLTDLHSSNGTYVNKRRVDKVDLVPGDRIYIGKVIFEIQRVRGTADSQASSGEPVDPAAETHRLAPFGDMEMGGSPTETADIGAMSRETTGAFEGAYRGGGAPSRSSRQPAYTPGSADDHGVTLLDLTDAPDVEELLAAQGGGTATAASTRTPLRSTDTGRRNAPSSGASSRSRDGSRSDHLLARIDAGGRLASGGGPEKMHTEVLDPVDPTGWRVTRSGRLNPVTITADDSESSIDGGLVGRDRREISDDMGSGVIDSPTSSPIAASSSMLRALNDADLLQRGDVVGPYRLEERVGRSLTGPVYRGVHTMMGSVHAIKVLPPQLARRTRIRNRFQWEAEVAGRFDHQNVRRLVNAGRHDDWGFAVYDFVEGADLGRLIHTRGALEPASLLALAKQVIAGVRHIHSRGYLHRAVTPSEILVPYEGEVRLCGFGMALEMGQESPNDDVMDDEVSAFDLAFRAPELLMPGEVRSSTENDVYGVCAALYFAASGREPIVSTPPEFLPRRILTDAPDSLALLAPDLPPDIVKAIHRGLSKHPEARRSVLDDLEIAVTVAQESHPTPSRIRPDSDRPRTDP